MLWSPLYSVGANYYHYSLYLLHDEQKTHILNIVITIIIIIE